MRALVPSCVLLAVWGLFACASGKDKGIVVTVVRSPDAVRGCDFLGRLSQVSTEQGAQSEGMLRQRVAELGGDTLLLQNAGAAEAWKCGGGSARAFVDSPGDRRRTPTALNRPPTPWTTPRYGG